MDRAYFPYFLDPKANIFIVESSLPNNNDKKKTYFSEVIRVSQSQLTYSGIVGIFFSSQPS